MSTIFVMPKRGVTPTLDSDDCWSYANPDDYIEVFFRGNFDGHEWLSKELEVILPYIRDVKIYPIDNTPQGVYTVEDAMVLYWHHKETGFSKLRKYLGMSKKEYNRWMVSH